MLFTCFAVALETLVNILEKCSMPQLNYPIAIMNLYAKTQLHMPPNNQLQNDKLVEHNAHSVCGTHPHLHTHTHTQPVRMLIHGRCAASQSQLKFK